MGRMQAQGSFGITAYLFFNPGQLLRVYRKRVASSALPPASQECRGTQDAEPPAGVSGNAAADTPQGGSENLPGRHTGSINTEPSIKGSLRTMTS